MRWLAAILLVVCSAIVLGLQTDVQLFAVRAFAQCDPEKFDLNAAAKSIAVEFGRKDDAMVDQVVVTSHHRLDEQAWPLFQFVASGNLAGEAVGLAGIGNGCGILEVDRYNSARVGHIS